MGNRRIRYLLLTSFCFYVIAVANDSTAMYVLCWVCVSLTLVAYAISLLGLTGLIVTREPPPRRVTAGQPFPMRVHLDNHGSFPKTNLIVTDRVENETVLTRTRRSVLVTWLPGESVLRVEPIPQLARRGRTLLGPVTVVVGDPLGLFERRREVPDTAHELLVHPQVVPLPRFAPSGLGQGQGRRTVRRAEGLEFHHLREYQQGDDLRHVDWKATAHTGHLHIREYEAPAAQRVDLLLDLDSRQVCGGGESSSLETAVTAAASVAQRSRELGYAIRLLAHEGRLIEALAGPGSSRAEELFDLLATVRGTGDVSAVALLRQQRDRVARAAVLVVITAAADPELADGLGRLAARGQGVEVVLLVGTSWDAGADVGRPEEFISVLGARPVRLHLVAAGDELGRVLSSRETVT